MDSKKDIGNKKYNGYGSILSDKYKTGGRLVHYGDILSGKHRTDGRTVQYNDILKEMYRTEGRLVQYNEILEDDENLKGKIVQYGDILTDTPVTDGRIIGQMDISPETEDVKDIGEDRNVENEVFKERVKAGGSARAGRFGDKEREFADGGRAAAATVAASPRTYIVLGWIFAALTILFSPYFALGGITFGFLANRESRGSGNYVVAANVVLGVIALVFGFFLTISLRRMMLGY